jgi:hypothetical protein
MWHYFVALPLVARIISLLGIAGLATWGWLKRKAISTAVGAVGGAVNDRFWGHLRKQLRIPSAAPTPSNLRSYRGIFEGCHQYANYPHENYFTLTDGSTRTKVPIIKTNLLSGVQHGETVEVDTQVGLARGAEVVLRVRIVEQPGRTTTI